MNSLDAVSNDNSPLDIAYSGTPYDFAVQNKAAIGLERLALDRAYASTEIKPEASHFGTSAMPVSNNRLLMKPGMFFASFCLWIIAAIYSYQILHSSPSPVIKILGMTMIGWAALFFAYVSKFQGRDFFCDFGLSGVIGALIGAIIVALTRYHLPIDLATLCGGLSLLTVILAALIKERYLLTISCMAALSWTAYSLLNLQSSALFWAFPIMWIIHMSLAVELRAKIPLALAIISGLFWLVTNITLLSLAAKISPLMAISAIFATGFAYSRIGKTMQDNRLLGGLFQTNAGWAVAAISALLLQDYWLMEAPHVPWTNLPNLSAFAYPMTVQWSVILIGCCLIIAGAGLLRIRMGTQTLVGSIGVLFFAALLPASIAFRPQLLAVTAQNGLQATPSVGILIGGAITALSLAMLVNGLRRSKPSMMVLALVTLSLEAIIVMESLFSTPDNVALFGFAVLIMTLTAGLYAHNGQNTPPLRQANA